MMLATALVRAPDLSPAAIPARMAGVRCIEADRSVAQAARLLARPEVQVLLVVEAGSDAGEGAVVGLLTERDLFRALAADGPAVYDRCIWLITDTDFPAIDVAASAGERLRAFCTRKVDHIALMDGCRVSDVLSIWDCADAQAASHLGALA